MKTLDNIGRTALIAISLLFGAGSAETFAQDSFYQGKTIRIIVGLAAGGGYDVYARAIARHMGKHIPGNPAIAVDNMTGAGSLVAANYLFKVAKPDGLIISHFIGGLFLHQLLGKPGIEFDAPKFEFIGTPMQDNFVLGVAKSTGVTDVEKWLASKQVVKFGGIASGTGSDDVYPQSNHRPAASIGKRLQGNFRNPSGVQWRRSFWGQYFMGVRQIDLAQGSGKR
jgi:tripartite-type tricarboxylate transporter receptor subunit TctC